MSLKEPESVEECVYFTNRIIDKGKIKAWVFRGNCPKCNKGIMSKPKNNKGKIQIRAKYYECPECKFQINDREYEESLNVNVKYTCPYCNNEGELQVPFKRKRLQRINEERKKETVDAIRFQCEKCGKDIDITKKMK